jgi:3-hydroxyacyl-CoA dehydrogenase
LRRAVAGACGLGHDGGGHRRESRDRGVSKVTLVDSDERALAAGMERVQGVLAASVDKGRLDAAAAAAAGERIRAARGIEALTTADLVIEAVFESLAVKQEVFAQLGALCAPGAVLATNTSTLDIDAIATGLAASQARRRRHAFLQPGPHHATGRDRSRPRHES